MVLGTTEGKETGEGRIQRDKKNVQLHLVLEYTSDHRLSPGLSGSFGDTVRDTKEYKGPRAVGSILLDLLLALLYRLEFHLKISFHV